MLAYFQHRHSLEVGDLMTKILNLRKQLFKDDQEKYEEAEQDERQYRRQVEEDKSANYQILNADEQAELKKKFRKASILCHPDKVNDEMKEEAERMFMELKQAYDSNNIRRVGEILDSLENNHIFKSKSETVTQSEKVRLSIIKIKAKIEETVACIVGIKENDTYLTISEIDDWDGYFTDLKQKLKQTLSSLKREVGVL